MPVCGLLVISLSHWTNFWLLTPENMSLQKYGLYTDTHFDAGLQTLPLCNHCTPVCTKLSHVSNETLYLFSTNREGTCTSLRLAGHGLAIIGVFTEKRQKKILESRPWSTMVDHGWPWLVSQPWLTMVDHGLAKLF